MSFIQNHYEQICVACISGMLIGLLVNLRIVFLLISYFISSGILALLFTFDYEYFFKDGFSFVHVIYLIGYFVISLVYFGPFGLFFGLFARTLKLKAIRVFRKRNGLS
jgi:hypothetical protein